jgi:hypothetical protein
MNAKTTTVTLVANGVTREFEFSHAERLLRMPNNGGWHLPEESKFEFGLEYGLRCRKDKKGNSGK